MSRNGLRPQPDKTDGARPTNNKPLRTHYYYD